MADSNRGELAVIVGAGAGLSASLARARWYATPRPADPCASARRRATSVSFTLRSIMWINGDRRRTAPRRSDETTMPHRGIAKGAESAAPIGKKSER